MTMNRLTRLTTVTACAVFFFLSLFTSSAQAQFLGLQSEVLAETELGTTYRVYAEFASASDECIAVYSVGTSECVENDENNNCIQMGPLLLELGVTTAFFQHPAAGDMGSGINPFFFPFYPEMEYDSWLTIGSSSTNDEAVSNIGMVSDLAEFASGTGFVMDETVGGSWYVTPGANPAAMAGDDGLVLLGQFTAVDDANGNPGHVTCLWNIQWRNNVGVSFKETGITHDTSGDGTVSGCMDASACNYNANATDSDDGCAFATGCDVCGGNATDGTGYVVDNDADNDGVCDVDEIAGCQNSAACNYDASATDAATCLYATGCDVCAGNPTNGTGTVLDLDADNDGVCDEDEIAGCQNSSACNYDASATDSGTACVFPFGCETCSGETNGTGTVVDNDSDGDGVCDEMKFPVAKSPQLATTTPQLRTPEPCVFTRRVVNHARDRPTVQEPYWPMTTTTMACAMQMKSQAAKTAQRATTTPPLRMRLTASSLRAATNAKAIQRMGQDRSTTSTPITMASAMQMKLPVARAPQRATTMLLRRIPPRVYSPQAAMCAQAMRRTALER